MRGNKKRNTFGTFFSRLLLDIPPFHLLQLCSKASYRRFCLYAYITLVVFTETKPNPNYKNHQHDPVGKVKKQWRKKNSESPDLYLSFAGECMKSGK